MTSKSIDPETLDVLRKRAREKTSWAAYQNVALDSSNAGHIQLLMVGEGCTYSTPPAQYPADTAHGAGWRYKLTSTVNLETGVVS